MQGPHYCFFFCCQNLEGGAESSRSLTALGQVATLLWRDVKSETDCFGGRWFNFICLMGLTDAFFLNSERHSHGQESSVKIP